MARELHKFAVTVPAGTLKTAPQTTNLTMPVREVVSIEVVVPPGPNGLVGFQLAMAGSQIIPYTPGGFVVASNEKMAWDFHDLPDSGAWQCIAYNTGSFNHTLEIRFLVELPALTGPAGATLVPLPMLSSA